MTEHLKDIEFKRYKKSEVAYHFNQPGHGRMDDVKIYVLEFVYEHPLSKHANKLRKTLEWNWIQRLKSVVPRGMNIMEKGFG